MDRKHPPGAAVLGNPSGAECLCRQNDMLFCP